MEAVPVAVAGVGAFGQNHARVLADLAGAKLVAVVDRDAGRAESIAQEYGCEALTDHRQLVGKVRAAVVAVPTADHVAVALDLLEAGIDTLVEKPLAPDLESADRLIEAAGRHGRILQAGHLERFNPVIEAAIEAATLPLFFEVHRLGMFTARSLDIDVVLDLMIHDLDIVLAIVDAALERVEAAGLPILSNRADIASIRLIFGNGCVANLTASRISTEKIRKLRYFQPRQYVSVDYSRQEGVVIGLDESNQLRFQPIAPEKGEPLARQAAAFVESVRTRRPAAASLAHVRRVLETALRIKAEMERHARVVEAAIAAHAK